MRPACMDAAEWAAWSETNDGRTPGLRVVLGAASPCHDCTLAFALEMRADGRCDGTPLATRPHVLTDDERVNRRRAQWRAYRARERRLYAATRLATPLGGAR